MDIRQTLLPKTDYAFNGIASSVQEIQLRKFIRTREFVSAILELRVYARTLTSTQEISIVLQPISFAPDDPAATFTTNSGEAFAKVTASIPTTLPALVVVAVPVPIPSAMRLLVRATQSGTPLAMSVTVSASLLGRDA